MVKEVEIEQMEPLLLRVEKAAHAIDMSRATIWELIRDGEIQVVRIGRSVRVPVSELHRLIQRNLS